jgi:1-acyl-sn-glycerol-3-phosphate acyltransferase
VRWRSHLLQAPLFALATAAFGTVALAASIFDKTGRWQHRIARCWAGVVLRICLSPVQVLGAQHLLKLSNQGQAAVYACNHLSYMDTPVVFSKLPFQFRILARHDLFKIPFIGWYLRRSGQIPVDSSHVRASVQSLNRGVQALQQGMPLVIFPEGGRSADGQIHNFLSGVAFMAIRARVPVVPMALVGTYELMPMHVYHLRPRPLYLVVGSPIDSFEYTPKTADALTQRIYNEVVRMYTQHSAPME